MSTATESRSQWKARMRELSSLQGSPETKSRAYRHLATSDLFWLLTIGLGRTDADRDWIYDRCREVAAEPDGHLDLWAREHYKSTIITVAKTIQDILRDPELTVGIFSHTRPIAKGFLRQIKRELEQNDLLKGLFPDILWSEPAREAPTWSEDNGIIVKRRGNPKESTVEAWGLVDGQPTGKHFKLLIYDDVVTRESVTSPEMIDKTTEAWALSRNLGSEGGRSRYIGTRYHYADTYAEMIRRGVPARLHPATVDGTVEGQPVLLSSERLVEKRREMGPYVFGCQMLQDPKADSSQGFLRDWVRYWQPDEGAALNRYILVDPASAKKKGADYTAIWCVGLGADQNIYVLDMLRDRLNLTERADLLFSWHRRFRPIGVGYERYGMMADIEHIQDRMRRENYRFSITELGGSQPKLDRIRRLVPLFEAGRVYLPNSRPYSDWEGTSHELVSEFLTQEYEAFPVGAHDDMLDALARLLDPEMQIVWPQSAVQPKQDRYARPERRQAGGSWMAV